jgi:hypothetical protein
MAKVLFILKKRETPQEESNALSKEIKLNFTYCLSSGLRNSANFVSKMLNEERIASEVVEVVDNNCIDREVTRYKPTHVIIEAFWVVPEKFGTLQRLHPNVTWIVRNHSEMPFLSTEGIAIDWSLKYLSYENVFLAPNSERSFADTIKMATAAYGQGIAEYKVIYLPNFYKLKEKIVGRPHIGETVKIGCFGAIRPLKNHFIQAIAAISYAQKHDKNLEFHINVGRIEGNGNPILNSLRGLFNNLDSRRFMLVEHGWLSHDNFIDLVDKMDIGLQCSFTESFNIVSADFVSSGVPLITSKEIFWLSSHYHAVETDAEDIVRTIEKVLYGYRVLGKAKTCKKSLIRYNEKSRKIWTTFFK